ncbi:MAG: hypothetical protein ACLUIQ_04865 [Dialister invisus]
MAEHHLDGKCLAVIFDGTGFGTDGTVWGGEFLLCEDRSFIRVGAVKPISMISGDESVRQAWKSLYATWYTAVYHQMTRGRLS